MSKAKRLRAGDMCEYEDCEAVATELAQGRQAPSWAPSRTQHPGVGKYCLVHAGMVQEEGDPEYTDQCPNCGCRKGVN